MVKKHWFLTRKKGISPTHTDMGEFLSVVLSDNSSKEQDSLAYKILTICYLEGWQVWEEGSEPEGPWDPFALHITHWDLMGRKTSVSLKRGETPVFACGVLGMDARERLLQHLKDA